MHKTRLIQIVLGALGAALLGFMIHKVGFGVLAGHLLQFGLGKTLLLILIYGLFQVFFCASWYWVLADPQKKLTFFRTFSAYLAGDALNMTVPSGNLAGEPVKVMFVKDAVGLEPAISAATVYKFSDFLSMTLFLLTGWALHFKYFDLPAAWNVGGGIVALGMVLASAVFFYLQKKGIFHPTGKWLEKLGVGWVIQKLESAHFIDHGVRTFYDQNPYRFAVSVLLNFIAWFGGVLEIVLFMAMAGLNVSFAAALTIETFSLFINNVVFFVPGRLGVGEGGRVLLFEALGYAAGDGLSYGIIRRIRELAWILAGLAILFFYKKNHPSKVLDSANH